MNNEKRKLHVERERSNSPASYPELMTEPELIQYLRIPEISDASDYHNVIEHLKRMRDLPRIRICNRVLYYLPAVRDWLEGQMGFMDHH
ncbi:hypothetical protein STSP2_01952 [Anaerohalosphaera lusitana]|uniref:Helix-turn-helix domain protein n=1 Tax=Anaerohalosphaera lusitana TaxID=1936003 RepID=A0A1U9NLJ1_9BACT|nr:hypothetical protein [Anaerohalosphaera lusitana]AQT68779.1 hypothetical protein STSP2_01952 [Anaerohalosphaera lusitana]